MNMHARHGWAPLALAVALAAPVAAQQQTAARPRTRESDVPASRLDSRHPSPAGEAQPPEEWGEPGAYYHALARMVGTWDVRISRWDPSGRKVEVFDAQAVIQPTLNEHYVEENLAAMGADHPYKAHGVTGYNTDRGQVESLWFDTESTAVKSFTGALTLPGDEFMLRGAGLGPDAQSPDTRLTTRFLSDDEFVVIETRDVGGRAQKVVERLYSRK